MKAVMKYLGNKFLRTAGTDFYSIKKLGEIENG